MTEPDGRERLHFSDITAEAENAVSLSDLLRCAVAVGAVSIDFSCRHTTFTKGLRLI